MRKYGQILETICTGTDGAFPWCTPGPYGHHFKTPGSMAMLGS